MNAISGAVTLRVSPPPAGTFLYRIVASAPGAHSAYAQLLVMGPAGVECNEDGGEVCFTHAVSVQWINEHIAQDVLRAMPVQDCTFSALSGQEYFDVDARTGAARMRAVDREDAAFDGAEAPVLRLWVHMSCDGDAARAPPVARAGSDYGNWTKMLGDVAHDPRSTVVLVEIVDINDNTPVFNPPSIVVGFPDSSLAERLRLPALFTAQVS
ncbi:Cadherin EGF LAG seven-pass G-type receptor 2, partial [Gryllus bimaculatus]